jgi:putative ABC transport system permease protein
MFRRDWRNGELRLLALSLALAVAAVTAVGFFTERVQQAMVLQASEVLAADLVLSGHDAIPDRFARQAREMSLQTATTLGFPSVVMQGDRTRLVEIKAVSPEYPLRGELRVRAAPDLPEQRIRQTPSPGELWVGTQLLTELGLDTGDRLSLGEREFRISRIISRDSGDAANLFRLGPRVLMALEDIPSTALVTPASRVHHQLLVAGAPERVERYRLWAEDRLPRGGLSLSHMSNARPALRSALDRGGRFLGLAALATVLMASAAVALSARRFVERQSDSSAILRCLGCSRGFILQTLLIRLSLLTLLASLAGVLFGYLSQFLLAGAIGDWFGPELPLPGMTPVVIGFGTGFATLFGFTLPSMLRLGSVPPLRVLRRDLGAPPANAWLAALSALAAIALLMLWQSGDMKLATAVMAGTLLTITLLLAAARLLIRLVTPLRHRGDSVWRYGLAGLARNPALTSLQLAGFGLGILALLLLAVVRVDLLNSWQRTIPEQAPNQFLINIQPREVQPLTRFLQQHGLENGGIHPMLRARLTRINAHTVSPDDYASDRARRLASREFNLSWSERLQADNRILSGQWWSPDQTDQPLFSVEQGVADELGIHLGDRLTFTLASVPIKGQVVSLRSVQWDSFRPNFFVIGTPGLLQNYPATYITSFYLPPGEEKRLAGLLQRFPSVTIIDVSTLMQQIREIIARGAVAVEFVFLFTLGAGMLVLYAGIQATREHRRQESAILRTLGLRRRPLLLAVSIEFVTLGVLAGLLASSCASLIGWYISTELLVLGYQFNPWLWAIGILGSGIGVGLAGTLATYPLVVKPPLETLRG